MATYRVGGHSPIKANVRDRRDHQNLETRVKEGLFREDLSIASTSYDTAC